MKLDKKQIVTGGSFNFGPNRSSNKTVNEVINLINRNFNNDVKIIRKKNNPKIYKESKTLMLDSSKSKKTLIWTAKYNLKKSINLTSSWFKLSMYKKNKDILKFTQEQIKEFLN